MTTLSIRDTALSQGYPQLRGSTVKNMETKIYKRARANHLVWENINKTTHLGKWRGGGRGEGDVMGWREINKMADLREERKGANKMPTTGAKTAKTVTSRMFSHTQHINPLHITAHKYGIHTLTFYYSHNGELPNEISIDT